MWCHSCGKKRIGDTCHKCLQNMRDDLSRRQRIRPGGKSCLRHEESGFGWDSYWLSNGSCVPIFFKTRRTLKQNSVDDDTDAFYNNNAKLLEDAFTVVNEKLESF